MHFLVLSLVRETPKVADCHRGGNGLEQGYSDVTPAVNRFLSLPKGKRMF